MSSLNKVMLIGRLGKAPEMRYTQAQKPVVSFSIATTEYAMEDGQKKEIAEWHNITAWEKLAENCHKFLVKGSLVYIEGRIKSRSWVTKEGEKRTATDILASAVQFLSAKPQDGQTQSFVKPVVVHSNSLHVQSTALDNFTFTDEDVPF